MQLDVNVGEVKGVCYRASTSAGAAELFDAGHRILFGRIKGRRVLGTEILLEALP